MKYFLIQERHIPKLPNLDYQIHIYQRSQLDYFKGWYVHYLFHWHDGRCKFYIPLSEYDELIAQVKDVAINPEKHSEFVDLFYKYVNGDPKEVFERSDVLLKTDPNSFSDQELARIVTSESIEFFVKTWYWLHLPPFFYGFEAYLKEVMEECGVSPEHVGEGIAILCMPTKPSANSKQEMDFLKLALLSKEPEENASKLDEALQKHFETYRYSVSAFGNEPFSFQALRARLQEYRNKPSQELSERIEEISSASIVAQEKKEEIFKSLGRRKGVKIASDLLSGMAYIRERNKEALGKVLYVYGRLYAEIANRAQIPPGHTDYYLLSELGQALIEKKKVPQEEIEKRRQCMVVVSEHEKYKKFLSGPQAHLLWETEIFEETNPNHKELHGTCGSPGTARGSVRIINSPSELHKMKEGEILVAPYTDHELVPAMKKAAAIITNEGGILAHAAVISREFKIPCIINTKIATSVLKDGDIVQVDANKGRVTLVENG